MTTSVCCVKVAHIRPAYANLAEWMADPNNVYVGRARIVYIEGHRYPPVASKWANPFKMKGRSREEVVQQFREYITHRLQADPALREELAALKGKLLGCWCHPEACHADVLAELAEAG